MKLWQSSCSSARSSFCTSTFVLVPVFTSIICMFVFPQLSRGISSPRTQTVEHRLRFRPRPAVLSMVVEVLTTMKNSSSVPLKRSSTFMKEAICFVSPTCTLTSVSLMWTRVPPFLMAFIVLSKIRCRSSPSTGAAATVGPFAVGGASLVPCCIWQEPVFLWSRMVLM